MNNFDSWETELYHHGILGMKWGVRRYQNPDGTLTSAGRKRRRLRDMSDDELKQRVNRLELEKKYRELNKGPIVRAIDKYRSYKNDQAKWRENKAHLVSAKVARSKLPIRNAIQSLPANLINTIGKKVNDGIDKGADMLVSDLNNYVRSFAKDNSSQNDTTNQKKKQK